MAVQIDVRYDGDLHCTVIHGPSGERFLTDAPVDNQGRGEHISPTDLVAASIGSCMLTIMGIAARTHNIDMSGARARVVKIMSAVPRRHIAKLDVEIGLPSALDARARQILERAAHGCPVHASLGPDTRVDLSFAYE
jgi:putative redox protein